MEDTPWFRHVKQEDFPTRVTLARLTEIMTQHGWDVRPDESSDIQINVWRDGFEIAIRVFEEQHVLAIDHYGTARYPASRLNEFIEDMNAINADASAPHVARLLPEYADDSHLCAHASSRFFTGAGLNEAQILAQLEAAISACLAATQAFERLKGEQTNA